MFLTASVLIILVSVILVIIVLAQNSKGGGLASGFGGGGNVAGGVVQTNKFLDKATWALAIALLVLSVTATLSLPGRGKNQESATKKYQNKLNTEDVPSMISPDEVKKMNEQKSKDNK